MLREPRNTDVEAGEAADHRVIDRGAAQCGGALDLHAGWAMVQRDWGLRQREPGRADPGTIARLLARFVEGARALARRAMQLVLRVGVALP